MIEADCFRREPTPIHCFGLHNIASGREGDRQQFGKSVFFVSSFCFFIRFVLNVSVLCCFAFFLVGSICLFVDFLT